MGRTSSRQSLARVARKSTISRSVNQGWKAVGSPLTRAAIRIGSQIAGSAHALASGRGASVRNDRSAALRRIARLWQPHPVYLLAPAGGGEPTDVGAVLVTVVTPQSPLGASLVGAHVGDEIEVDIGAERRRVVVAWLR